MALGRVRYVRVIEPMMLKHPVTGDYVVPSPARPLRTDDPLVKVFPWAFEADEDKDTSPIRRRGIEDTTETRDR